MPSVMAPCSVVTDIPFCDIVVDQDLIPLVRGTVTGADTGTYGHDVYGHDVADFERHHSLARHVGDPAVVFDSA